MVKLGVNIDHVATIRQQRRGIIPSLLEAARICEVSGAEGITVHLREDRRHIQDSDVRSLRQSIQTKLNLEMAASDEILKVALDIVPDDVCLVPEKRQELTTEGGLDVSSNEVRLKSVVMKLKSKGVKVSMFVDPDISQIEASKRVGADAVELHTGEYANEFEKESGLKKGTNKNLQRLIEAGKVACELGLILNAGHGLDYKNVVPVVQIENMNELNIGFSIIADSIFNGLEKSVKEMKRLIESA